MHRRILFLFCLCLPATWAWAGVSLPQAERRAVAVAPSLHALEEQIRAEENRTVAAAQWSDPSLHLGALNFPADDLSTTEENMTQLSVGLTQALPKGKSLKYRRRAGTARVRSLLAQKWDAREAVKRDVRAAWLEVYYWQQAQRIVQLHRKVFGELLSVSEALLGAGKQKQQDVLDAQLQLSSIDSRLLQISRKLAAAQADLNRLLDGHGNETIVGALPTWSAPKPRVATKAHLSGHPRHLAALADIAAAGANVRLAKTQFKPGYNVGMRYGHRNGTTAAGKHREDLVSAEIGIELPIFPGNRQQKIYAAAQADLVQQEALARGVLLDLEGQLAANYPAYTQLVKEQALYRDKLKPQAKQYAESALQAYQNDQTDFLTVMRAAIAALETDLKDLRVQVDSRKVRAQLFYLEVTA